MPSYVQQSGNVTPGHQVRWATNGVVEDGGANPYSQRAIASLLNVSFNTTSDQPILLPSTLNRFQLTGILIANPSGSLNGAVGGFYPEAEKAGSALVAAGQAYSTLSGQNLLMNATLTAYAQAQMFSRFQLVDWTVYFSLTTALGADATADIYVLGIELG